MRNLPLYGGGNFTEAAALTLVLGDSIEVCHMKEILAWPGLRGGRGDTGEADSGQAVVGFSPWVVGSHRMSFGRRVTYLGL